MENDSIKILKQRYAKGEITQKEFKEMKKEILSEKLTGFDDKKDIENLKQYPKEDKFLSDLMGKDEKVITSYSKYYATNKRIIYYEKKIFGKNFNDMSYAHISSIQLKNKARVWLIVLGIIIFIDGAVIYNASTSFSILIIIVGILIVVIGMLWRKGYYELYGGGGEKWRIPISNDIVATQFVKIIRENLVYYDHLEDNNLSSPLLKDL